jgi:hypothetical protein
VRVTEKSLNLPPYPWEDKKKFYVELPPFAVAFDYSVRSYPFGIELPFGWIPRHYVKLS